MTSWDVNRVKAQLRLTAQRLGQLQDKMESLSQITRRDIATLLQQGNLILARAKAQKLLREDIYGDLLQTLEMQVGVILEHTGEIERSDPPSPIVVEAASSIIFAAHQTESRDLQIVRDILVQRLGPDFARSASGNRDNYVSARVVRALSFPPPSGYTLDRFLFSIARAHGVQWTPDLQPNEKVDAISALLDPSSTVEIDLVNLRMLCSHGLPDYPPWLRPRVWRLLLGTLPTDKSRWSNEARTQRDSYYDLLRRLLEPFGGLPPPTSPLASLDASLLEASKALAHVPRSLYAKLEEEPEKADNCPLDETAPEDIKIACAGYLDARLHIIREAESGDDNPADDDIPEIRLEGTPEIRLETMAEDASEGSPVHPDDTFEHDGHLDTDAAGTPEISLSAPDSPSSAHSGGPTTLLASRLYSASGAHPKHASALLRLLYVHSSLNPASRSPQIASLLVPLYTALIDEVDQDDFAHIEADAFWLFEAMVGEFSELEEAEGGNVWMRKISDRLKWADMELAEDLEMKGLDPLLPHYSYRWLTTLMTHTLPLSAVLTTWDALFSRQMRGRESNPKLEYLVDICTSLLLCARGVLLRLGRPHSKLSKIWGDENSVTLSSPLSEREVEEAFIEGMALLQTYRLEDIGGIDRVLQLAWDLAVQRENQTQVVSTKTSAAGLGTRFRNSVWKNFSAPAPIAEVHEETEESESEDSTDEDEPLVPSAGNSQPSTLSARLAQSVWKGITNQSAMEPPPSPVSPMHSPAPPSSPLLVPSTLHTPEAPPHDYPSTPNSAPIIGSGIWGYAEKLRDSDTAAALAKVSTNWRVKAWDAWSKRGNTATPANSLSPSWVPSPSNRGSLDVNIPSQVYDQKRNSLPGADRTEVYSPPARPAYFRPPRDSMFLDPRRDSLLSPTGSDMSTKSENDASVLQNRRESLALLDRTPSPLSAPGTRSGGPRPLLLNSASLITHSRSPTLPASTIDSHFADAVRAKRPPGAQRGSQSSVSSISPSDHMGSGRARAIDTIPSRVIPLNRKTPSPMARSRRQESLSSAASSHSGVHRRLPTDTSPESDEQRSQHGWRSADAHRSIEALPSSPLPARNGAVRVVTPEPAHGSEGGLSEFGEVDVPFSVENTPKVSRKPHTGLSRLQIEDSSDSSITPNLPARASRVRSKRYPPRLANLRTRENSKGTSIELATSPNTLAAPEWPEDGDATTPRAANFEDISTSPSPSMRRARKLSGEGRTRKVSADGSGSRTRKISSEKREPKHKRESAAVEGDDEGYDELLSAYESEDSAARH